MRIAETFSSLQGEGMLAGVPSFFIRVSGCNLRCVWCDTPYASWRPEGGSMSVGSLVEQARASGMRHIVLTGGEPLAQRDVGALTAALAAEDFHVTVETAGTLAPSVLTCHLLSLSPKTANSDPAGPWRQRHRRRRSDLSTARDLLQRFPGHQVKLVVEGEGDMEEVLALVAALDVERERVLLMPQARGADELGRRAPTVARLCLEHGFRYSPRLQIDLFGGGRGV